MPSIDARLHHGALVRREGARHQQIAVGAERLVGFLELVQLRVVLLAAPVIEIAEEAARLLGLSGRPGGRRGQAVEQRKTGDGDEALLAARAFRHHGVEGGDLGFVGRACRRASRQLREEAGRGRRRAACTSVEDMVGLPSNHANRADATLRRAEIAPARPGLSRVEVLGLSRLAGHAAGNFPAPLWRCDAPG